MKFTRVGVDASSTGCCHVAWGTVYALVKACCCCWCCCGRPGDVLQNGGVVVLDAQGQAVFQFSEKRAQDHADPQAVMKAAQALVKPK